MPTDELHQHVERLELWSGDADEIDTLSKLFLHVARIRDRAPASVEQTAWIRFLILLPAVLAELHVRATRETTPLRSKLMVAGRRLERAAE